MASRTPCFNKYYEILDLDYPYLSSDHMGKTDYKEAAAGQHAEK